jgi:hypothetical protein
MSAPEIRPEITLRDAYIFFARTARMMSWPPPMIETWKPRHGVLIGKHIAVDFSALSYAEQKAYQMRELRPLPLDAEGRRLLASCSSESRKPKAASGASL